MRIMITPLSNYLIHTNNNWIKKYNQFSFSVLVKKPECVFVLIIWNYKSLSSFFHIFIQFCSINICCFCWQFTVVFLCVDQHVTYLLMLLNSILKWIWSKFSLKFYKFDFKMYLALWKKPFHKNRIENGFEF